MRKECALSAELNNINKTNHFISELGLNHHSKLTQSAQGDGPGPSSHSSSHLSVDQNLQELLWNFSSGTLVVFDT